MNGRIWFPRNPWPRGHPITHATWSGRLDPEGRELRFDLDVATAAYAAESPGRDTGDDRSWRSPLVWTNYGRCSLSSTKWGPRGFSVGTAATPFAWSKLSGATYRVDRATTTLPEGTLAFGIYLMGHDGIADHALRFTRAGRTWSIDWKAKIALAYIGDVDLAYRMKLELRGLTFGGFAIPTGMRPARARALFDPLVADPSAWRIERRRFVR